MGDAVDAVEYASLDVSVMGLKRHEARLARLSSRHAGRRCARRTSPSWPRVGPYATEHARGGVALFYDIASENNMIHEMDGTGPRGKETQFDLFIATERNLLAMWTHLNAARPSAATRGAMLLWATIREAAWVDQSASSCAHGTGGTYTDYVRVLFYPDGSVNIEHVDSKASAHRVVLNVANDPESAVAPLIFFNTSTGKYFVLDRVSGEYVYANNWLFGASELASKERIVHGCSRFAGLSVTIAFNPVGWSHDTFRSDIAEFEAAVFEHYKTFFDF